MKVPIKGGVVVIDESDLHLLEKYTWFVKDNGYAVAYRYIRGSYKTGQRQERVRLHRLIIGAKDGEIVDHINRNKLDNRRSNLRIANKSQNAANSKIQSNNSSGFRGVSFQKNIGKWMAYINKNGKRLRLGYFDTAKDAANVRDKKAKELFGEFANAQTT